MPTLMLIPPPPPVTSGLLSGGPRGGLLSGERLHRGTAAHAGNETLSRLAAKTPNPKPQKPHRVISLSDVTVVLAADAGGGGLLRVRQADAGLQTARALQAQYG